MLPLGIALAPVVPYLGRVGADGKTFQERLAELVEGHNKTTIAKAAHLSRAGLDLLLSGVTKAPTIQTADALAKALKVSSDYLLYGRDPGEEDITTLEQLHDWEVRIMRQRERHLERILATQRGEVSAGQRGALVQSTAETRHANGESGPTGTPAARAGNAA